MLQTKPSPRTANGTTLPRQEERYRTYEAPTKTQGEVEAAVCQGMSRFEQEFLGRGPTDIQAHLIGEILVIRLRGVLTPAEQHLAALSAETKGSDLLKHVRAHLIEKARPRLEAMVHEITGVKVLNLFEDISTVTDEEIVVFTLEEFPLVRDTRNRQRYPRPAVSSARAEFA